ncbi:MAG: hypothetical protein EA369_01425 [Bradymonadales bacterium]|nr:MAG: hypothetical protein EA369_01425 [Bradymonadales bacterium]
MGLIIRSVLVGIFSLGLGSAKGSDCAAVIRAAVVDPFNVTRLVYSSPDAVGEALRRFLQLDMPAERRELPQVPVGSLAEFFSFHLPAKSIGEMHKAPQVKIYGEMLAWFWLTQQGNIPDGALLSCRSCGTLPDTPVLVEMRSGSDVERLEAGMTIAGVSRPIEGVSEFVLTIESRDGRFKAQFVEDLSRGGFLVKVTTVSRGRFRNRVESHSFQVESLAP